MSQQTENRLQAALAAKAGGITEGMLRQPLLPERTPEYAGYDSDVFRLDPAAGGTGARQRLRPQLVAAAAIAAVAAVILAMLVTLGWPAGRRQAPPGTSSSSTPGPTGPSGYLGQGQTGSRAQVPWPVVGSGWRLLQPLGAASATTRSLYLYDPADGRYLITDRLPADGRLLAWSPDGARALVQTPAAFLQIQLRTGAVVSSAVVPNSVLLTYTPSGTAMIVSTYLGGNTYELRRYGMNGTLQHRYPTSGAGGTALYAQDGNLLLTSTGGTQLVTDAGTSVRSYPAPDGETDCTPVQLWADGFLEACQSFTLSKPNALYVQPLAGGPARVLIDQPGASGGGYTGAWQLSNGDVLLRNLEGSMGGPCVNENYSLLHSDGTVTALRLPAEITSYVRLANMNHDLATFKPGFGPCSDPAQPYQPGRLVDYNIVTGQTSTLPTEDAELVNYPTEG